MEAVNSESLQQSINIEHLNRITLDNNDCLSAINLGKNSWKFNASTDLLKYDNNKATTEHIYNNKYNNTNEKSYTTVEAEEEEEAESESHMNNDSSSNTQEFENNKIVVDNERTHNNILHKIEDKIIENIFKKNCLNHILTNEQNKHNQTEQLNSNRENLQNNINKNKDNDNNEEQEEEKPVSTNCVKEEKIEKELILDNNHQTNNDINLLNNNNNNVPTTTTNGEELEETEKKKEEKEQVENEKEKVPVELTTDISADANVEIKQTTINSRSRCSSISSIASNYSTSSGNTPNLVIDHLVAAQQFSKRKVSSWSSSSDTEEPAAKQAHLDTADAQPDPSASSRETTSSSSSSSDENEDKTENCNAVVQQQSPLKIKIVQNPASIEENKCHEIADTEISAQQPNNDCDNNDSQTTIMQEISPTTENTTNFVDHLNTKNQLETTTVTTITSPTSTPKTVGTTVISSLAEPETVIKKKNTKSRYYKCASCRTLHEGWNFFMHIYETHQRYICLYCIKVFATAEKLSVHLEIKHDLEQDHFNSEEALRHYEHVECQAKYLMCCTCQHMFIDQEPFSNHDCNMYMRPCALCGQMGRHSNNCKAHPDATRRNNKIKAKPPPNSNRQQATSNLNAIGAVTDCDKVEATLKGIPQQQQQQQTFEQSNEITHLPQQASSVDYNLQETTQEKPTIEAVEEVEQEENEEIGEEEVVEEEIPPKLVVPKFKLRVPKEFQKSVDAVISSSEESENDSDNISTGSEVEQEEREVEIEAQPENLEINAEKKALEADLDVSDDTDSPTENCLNKSMSMDNSDLDTTESRQIFKEEWEQRLKESVHDMKLLNSQQDAVMETEEAEEKVNETSMNGTATHTQWSPTPPASPKIPTQQENEPTTEQNEPTLLSTTNEEEPIAEAVPQTEIVNSEIEPQVEQEVVNEEAKLSPKIDIEAASEEDALPIQIKLDRPLDLYENPVEFIRYCLNYSFPICLYCNHARRIAVNAQILVTHMLENHRYTPAVNGITAAEDIKASSLMDKLKAFLPQLQTELYINGNNFNSLEENKVENERIYECFMCRFITKTHKELYLHNRKMHLRSAVLCFMCRAHFVSFTEVLCHICPGAPHKQLEIDIKYRCCLCNLSNIPSSFRLMVHLRKKHNSCDVCLEDCVDQTRLSSHVWKHKFRHYCYRCNISYRNKNDIINHLYWKHGTESTPCKRCQSKRWRHVYHFCTPNGSFVCETCNECFSKVMYLNVHQRLHAGELKYACEMENCVEKFISRRLLHKHKQEVHKPPIAESTETEVEKDKKEEEEEEKAVTVKESEQKLSEEVEKSKETAESEQQEKSTKEDNVEDTAEVETMKNRKQVLTFDVLNLSESSDSSSDGENSDNEQQQQHKIERLTRITDESSRNADETDNNKLLALNENEKLDKDNNNMEKSENTENVLDIWKNFLNAQAQKNTEDLEEQEDLAVIDEDCRPSRLHVAYSDHDYCCLFNPNEHKKKERNKEEKERKSATPTTEKVQVTLTDNEANNESSSDSESSDESGCSCGSNCSNCGSSSSNSDSDSSNSNSSDSDSSDDSHKSHQKKSLNKSKDSNSNRSPHKKHHRHDSVRTEIQVDDTDNHEEVAMEIEPPRAPQIFESDLETSDLDSDEEFYAEHPRKEAQEMLIKEQAAVVNEVNAVNNELTKTEDILANGGGGGGGGGGGVDNLLDNEHDNDKKERKKLKKKKRDKRNNNNNSNKEPQNNVILNNIMQQCQNNQMYNIFSTTAVEPALGMDGAYNAHMPFAAEQTVITGAHSIISEGGGSSSEADGSLKRSKRMRRPNKFYGYTSDDETMSGQQQSLMIGSRAFKPQPPPQLTWNKDDLPTPSKSILNQNKAPRSNQRPSKATPTRNLDEAFGEFAQLINQDTRKRTFGIAAGGKIGGDGAFYKRAAKKGRVKSRQLSSTEEEGGYNLPPIPRLKIKPSQIGLNLDILKKKRINSTSSSSASSSEDEFVPTEVNTQAAKTLNVKPHLQFNALATPTAVLQAQQQHQQQQSQEQASLPAAISTPIPKTTAFNHSIPPALLPNPDFATLQYFKANNIRYPIRPPAGARQAREGESVYCYCRCPYDEVSEMIACDGDNCVIEWFHFECVGIMMAPQGKWYCAECRPKYISNSLTNLVKPPF